jgi:hypothetical protein
LDLVKAHVRADDYELDDDLLAWYRDAAVEHVVGATNRSVDDLLERGGGKLPLRLQQAVLLVVGHWYNQREESSAVQMHKIPDGADALIKPFRKLSDR